ncbi:MAG: CBS domain-containing protein [Bacteroidota bacterium]
MIAKDLLTEKIQPIRTSTTGLDALAFMDEYRVFHLPVVNDLELLGFISEEDINSYNHLEESIGNYHLSLGRLSVSEEQHIYDVIRLMTENKLSLIPVTDKHNIYQGVITQAGIVAQFAQMASLMNPGGIIVLEINERDYSLSEIAQIVESNDASVLSVFLKTNPESTKMEVTLKLNKLDIGAVLQTFSRYEYTVKASFTEGDDNELLRDRFDSLMTYLSI